MSPKFFYAYIVLGVLFLLLTIYAYLRGNATNYSLLFDLVITIFLFYRAYRVYKTKQDGELM